MSESPKTVIPPVLYIPVIGDMAVNQRAVIRELADGRTCLLAYTALDRLADKCGENQAWILMSTADVGQLKKVQPFDIVTFDLEVPLSLRKDGKIA